MSKIAQATHTKVKNRLGQKFDTSLNYYLKDFYEKNEIGLPMYPHGHSTIAENEAMSPYGRTSAENEAERMRNDEVCACFMAISTMLVYCVYFTSTW